MSEVLWNLRHKQLMIQVERVSSNRYRLRIGTWISKPFHQGEIALNLLNLYTTAHELGTTGSQETTAAIRIYTKRYL